jgi:hypothetical protein
MSENPNDDPATVDAMEEMDRLTAVDDDEDAPDEGDGEFIDEPGEDEPLDENEPPQEDE